MSDANDHLPTSAEINELLADHAALFNQAFYGWYEHFNGGFKDVAGRPDALPFKATRAVQEWIMYNFSNMIMQLHHAQADELQAVRKSEQHVEFEEAEGEAVAEQQQEQ